MGRIALTLALFALPMAATGTQPYTPSNAPTTFTATSPTYGTATATIQETAGQSSGGGWTYCAAHAVDGPTCASAGHLAAGTVSKWIGAGATTLATLPNGAQCYQHTDAGGVTWCYAGEPVQDQVGATGGPFGTAPDTAVSALPGAGEAWWGSGGGPSDAASCQGMFGDAPTGQASLPSCEQQFGTVTWDTSGTTVAAVRGVADEMTWRIGSWNGQATPGGVACASRTAIGGTAADSQAPSGLWMQWASNPARGFWNCTAQDASAGPPQAAWNGSSWYARSAADWNGFGWYLVYLDYSSFIELPATVTNGVATSIACGGHTSPTTVSAHVPARVAVTIDSSGLATFTDETGALLSQVSCAGTPTTPPPPASTTPPVTAGPPVTTALNASPYLLVVPVGQTGAINVLRSDSYRGAPTLSLLANASQPGTLDADPSSVDFGYFSWSPTQVGDDSATYQICDPDGCANAPITLRAVAAPSDGCPYYCGSPPPSSTTAPPPVHAADPHVTLRVDPNAYPPPGQGVMLTATAADPTEATFDLRVEQVGTSTGGEVADCGQVLQCQAFSSSPVPTSRRFVGVLSYPDGAPPQYSNEVTVTWTGNVVTLNACLSTAPCTDINATPASGQTAYLTATTYNVDPPNEAHEGFWQLDIVDAATHQSVSACPLGESPCQVPVTAPDGASRDYFAVLTFRDQAGTATYSNPASVRWGTVTPPTAPPTTAPPTTAPPATTPPATSPPPTSPPSTAPPGSGAVRPT